MSQSPADKVDAQIAAHVQAGENEAAAELLDAHGRHREASDRFADAWQFERAAICAIKSKDLALAYQHVSRWPQPGADKDRLANRIMDALLESPASAEEAARWASDRGQHHEAGRLWFAAGDFEHAAEAYEQAEAHVEAARLRERLGDYRAAGRLYEARLREHPDDAEASLRLGQILLSFGRREAAARVLQAITSADEAGTLKDATRPRDEARHLLIHCFWSMGQEDAAHRHLDALRRRRPEFPPKADAYVSAYPLLQSDGQDAPGPSPERLLAGRYEVMEPIGAGATGRVLLARDTFFDRLVAIKVLTVSVMGVGRDAYNRFLREARIAAAVAHPNIVQMTEFNPHGPFIVMEYMSGGTLESRIRDAHARGIGLDPLAVRHIATSVLRGLDALHRRGVVHRDIKPANIFFGPSGNVKVGDFGASHLTDLGSTLTGALLGTLAYMAPEQITGGEKPGPSTDLYAFGILLHELLTGSPPFEGPDFVSQHLHDAPAAPSRAATHLQVFDELCAGLLEKRSADRPQSADAVQAMLASLPWDALVASHETARAHAPEADAPDTSDAPTAAPTSSPLETAGRFVPVEALKSGVVIARDEFLKRLVRIEPADPARCARLRDFAAADHPNLQAVYDVDEPEGRAVIERPQGQLLSQTASSRDLLERVHRDISDVLEHLALRHLRHGQIDADHIRVGPQRCVLLLPTVEDGSDGSDSTALQTLIGRLEARIATDA